mmetsp:Transcript_5747/g.13098  ORF Transcript_5747/g.13098 Transcript_5747/m.13098 type:complete len:292 (+) Transcript_5747:500-1375(+)
MDHLQGTVSTTCHRLDGHLLHRGLAVVHGGLAGEHQEYVELCGVFGVGVAHRHAMNSSHSVLVADLVAVLIDNDFCLDALGIAVGVLPQDAVPEAVVCELLDDWVPDRALVVVELPDAEEADASTLVAVDGVHHLPQKTLHGVSREHPGAVVLAGPGFGQRPPHELHASSVHLVGRPSVDVADKEGLALGDEHALHTRVLLVFDDVARRGRQCAAHDLLRRAQGLPRDGAGEVFEAVDLVRKRREDVHGRQVLLVLPLAVVDVWPVQVHLPRVYLAADGVGADRAGVVAGP